jgi:hypothetical protein
LWLAVQIMVSVTMAQQPTTENPLAKLKDSVQQVLAQAGLPFNEAQEKAIILMMEDRRKASEDLFGDLMNFSAGPTQGHEADRLRSAITWLENEFITRLQDHLTPDQISAWNRARETAANGTTSSEAQPAQQQNQTQYVRINNNSFTAEDAGYRNSRFFGRSNAAVQQTEIIQRGGAGAWHGNAQFLLKDAGLNAGRRFAGNKPPYQERQTSFDVSGPAMPGKLTTRFAFIQNEAENVDTIRATLPDSTFALGITRPATSRSFSINNTFQLSDRTSFSLNGGYATANSANQGVGGFVMPDRAFTNTGKNWNFEARQFSSLSSSAIYETRFSISGPFRSRFWTLSRTEERKTIW